MRKALLIALALLLLAGLGASWYYSGLILDGVAIKGDTGEPDNTVTAISADTITYSVDDPEIDDVAADDNTRSQVGLRFEDGGFLLLAQGASVDGRSVTRGYTLLEGERPEVGELGEYDWNSFPGAPAMGLAQSSVTYPAPLGPTPAVLVPGTSTADWAIVVHGRNASVREGLRVVPQLNERGFTTMLINYRDDLQEPGAPFEDGIGNFGVTEWPDLQAAIRTAQERGAQRIVLVGYSMGGAIIAAYLEHAEPIGPVAGTILISPAVSLPAIVDWGAVQKGLPVGPLRPVIWGAQQITQLRSDLDFGAADYLDDAGTWPVPALVTAGTEDDLVPPEVIEEFAGDLPVGQFQLFDSASHTGEWNTDQQEFDALVGGWLDDLPRDTAG